MAFFYADCCHIQPGSLQTSIPYGEAHAKRDSLGIELAQILFEVAIRLETSNMSLHSVTNTKAKLHILFQLLVIMRKILSCFRFLRQVMSMREMMQRAQDLGANAIVGIDIDYETVGANGSMLMVATSGTAVVI